MLKTKRKEIDERVKFSIVEAFVEEELLSFVEENLGIDWRIVLEEEKITPYIQRLIDQSFYFEFQKNGRTELEFVKELIYSRCIELKLKKTWGDLLIFNGSDKDCLITQFTNTRSDFRMLNSNSYFEVISNYNGHFSQSKSFYLSTGKMEALMVNASKNLQYVLAVDVLFKSYYIVEIRSDLEEMTYVKKSPIEDGGYWISLRGIKEIKLGEEEFINGSICSK